MLVLDDKLAGRICGYLILISVFNFILWIIIFLDGKAISWNCIRYACKISVPLVPHALSGIVLGSSDRIMITYYCESEVTAVYSLKFLSGVRGISVSNTGCPSLWKLTPCFCEKIPCEKARNAVVTVSGHRKYRNAVKDQKMIDLIERNYEKIYLWVQSTEDEQYFKLLKHTKGVKKIYSLHEYGQVCKNGNVDYIGTRLHGGIYAMRCKNFDKREFSGQN